MRKRSLLRGRQVFQDDPGVVRPDMGQVVQVQSLDPGRVLGDEPAGSAAEVEDFFTAAEKGKGGSVEIDFMIVGQFFGDRVDIFCHPGFYIMMYYHDWPT